MDSRNKGKALKAVLDARRVPFVLFGQGHAAHLRKFIYMYLATWADPDGTEAYPALSTIAEDCGLTVRGLSDIIDWLAEHGLITVQSKGSHLGTNKYAVLLTAEALAAARLKVENDEVLAAIRAKAEGTRKLRSDAAKALWAKKKASADIERCVLGEREADLERSVLGDIEHSVLGGHGTECIEPRTDCIPHRTQRSTNRPLDRPPNRERDREETTTATASLQVTNAANAAQTATETDYHWIGLQMAKNSWPIAPQAERIIRAALKEGQSKDYIFQAIQATFDGMPQAERQPGLYLGQNLRANLDLLTARGERNNANNDCYPQLVLPEERTGPTWLASTPEEKKRFYEENLAAARAEGNESLFDVWNQQYRGFMNRIGETPTFHKFRQAMAAPKDDYPLCVDPF
jgi:hypothetical protein